jgi:hypothetical protein
MPVPAAAIARALQALNYYSTAFYQPTGRRTLDVQIIRGVRADASTPPPIVGTAYVVMAITKHTDGTAVLDQDHAGSAVATPTILSVGFTNKYPLAAGGTIGVTFKDSEFPDLHDLRPFVAGITGVGGVEGAARTVIAEPTRSAQATLDGESRTEVLLRVGEGANDGAGVDAAITLELNHVLRECPTAPETATIDIRTYNANGATLAEMLGVVVNITSAVSDPANHHITCQVEPEIFPEGMTCVDGRLLYDLMMSGKAEADPAQFQGGAGHREVCTVHCTLCTVHYALCTVHCALCTVHYTL